jgi:hypothetical protein
MPDRRHPFAPAALPIVLLLTFGVATASAALAAPCPARECDPAILGRRSLVAAPLSGPPPTIDGRLDEPAWATTPVAADFVESSPRPAAHAGLRSEARVLVDAEALYVGLRYFDPEPARIQGPLARRDDETTSDWAFVEIDCRHDRRTAFSFGVNPRGLQVDGLWLSDTVYDTSWNGVWESAARIDGQGWTAELRIPFSQLAFNLPAGAAARELVWGINFYRHSPAHGETSNWSPRYRGLGGIVANFNDLRFAAPPAVRRLELTPYSAARAGNESRANDERMLRAGADLRAGLGSSFSLTATLLPDFGQVEADPSQVNLRAFELFQTEQRPFFLEGLDVFRLDTSLAFTSRDVSFAEESPFYSRRIGRAPRGETPAGSTVESIPTATSLLGAAKLAGQTAGGWTLGIFSAVADREQARLRRDDGSEQRWPVEARSATTVARAIKNLQDGDTSLGLYLADLQRLAVESVLAEQEVRAATALGGELQHRFGAQKDYELRSWVLASRLTGNEAAIARVAEAPQHYFQRPDAPRRYRGPYGNRLEGIAGEARLSRIGGALHWDLVGRAVSPGFDVNEIGFQRNADWLLLAGTWQYAQYPAAGPLRTWTVGSGNLGWGWTWDGEPRARVADAYLSLDTRSYWNVKLTATRELSALSLDWLRGGPALELPQRSSLALSFVTDQRRPTQSSLDLKLRREPASGSWSASVAPLLNVRSSDVLQWSVGPTYQVDTVGWQFVGRADTSATPTYIVGRVRQETLSATLRADLTLTPHLAIQAYLQPFATTGRYDRFQRLANPRAQEAANRFRPFAPGQATVDRTSGRLNLDLDGDGAFDATLPSPDAQERSLNGNLVLRWEYRPGSYLTAVWNQQRGTTSNEVDRTPGGALGGLFSDHATNIVLVKLSRRFGW